MLTAPATTNDDHRFSPDGGLSGDKILVSGITYTVGADARKVPWTTRSTTSAGSSTPAATQTSPTSASASAAPASFVPTGGGADRAIGNIVLQEQRAGAIQPAGACVQLIGPAGTTFDDSPEPTNTASGGTGVGVVGTGVVNASGPDLPFTIQTASTGTGATTYTLSNVRVNAGPNPGAINAKVGPTCGSTAFGTIRLGFVGAVDRIQGSDRYATAAQIAFQNFGCLDTKTVVIARGDAFPDALAASYLAGKNQAPILLTAPTTIPPETLQALEFHGVKNVVLVGGTAAISQGVQDFLDAKPTHACGGNASLTETIAVDRVFGADRFATAKNVAEKPGLGAAGTLDSGINAGDCATLVKTAIVASGENFPDALSAGGLAYGGAQAPGCGSGGIPLLLTTKDTLSAAAQGAITNLGIQQVILMGGTAAVAAGVETSLDNMPGVSVIRVAGPTAKARPSSSPTGSLVRHRVAAGTRGRSWCPVRITSRTPLQPARWVAS